MIGVLIVAHGTLGESLVSALTHVLGSRPTQLRVLPITAADDPVALLPRARDAVAALDTGDGVAVFCDIFGATPCNLSIKLAIPGRVEVISGVNLPMLVRAFTYRTRNMDTLVTKAVSGGCEGVMHVPATSRHATTRG
ncbi:MAG TPA: PTS sugar transporter subunit IIA [Casimicrobiaceae bacterium]|nr:PTS sugar transporter subunit IIA [Casimicrobiaceae bacterium]